MLSDEDEGAVFIFVRRSAGARCCSGATDYMTKEDAVSKCSNPVRGYCFRHVTHVYYTTE